MNETELLVTQGDPTLTLELKHRFKEEVSLLHSTYNREGSKPQC